MSAYAYSCSRCGYSTDVKGNFKIHIYRNNTCPPRRSLIDIIDIRETFERQQNEKLRCHCRYCNKALSSPQSRCNHEKNYCKFKPNTNEAIESLISKRVDEEVTRRLLSLSSTYTNVHNVVNSQQANTINNTNNTVNVNLNFNLKDFEPDVGWGDHLTDEFKTACLMEMNFPKLIKAIFCNEQVPENQCIRLKNVREKKFEVVNEGKWVTRNGEETLSELLDKGYKVLKHHWYWDGKKHDVDDVLHMNDCYGEVKRWLDKISEEDAHICSDIKNKTFMVFVDQKQGHIALLTR